MFWPAGSFTNYLVEKTWNNEDSEVEDEGILPWDDGEEGFFGSDENNLFNDIGNGLTSVGDDIGRGVGDVGEGIAGDGEWK